MGDKKHNVPPFSAAPPADGMLLVVSMSGCPYMVNNVKKSVWLTLDIP